MMIEFTEEQNIWLKKQSTILNHVMLMMDILKEIPEQAFDDDGSRLISHFGFMANAVTAFDFLFKLNLALRGYPGAELVSKHLVKRMNGLLPNLTIDDPTVFTLKTKFTINEFVKLFLEKSEEIQSEKPGAILNSEVGDFILEITQRLLRTIVIHSASKADLAKEAEEQRKEDLEEYEKMQFEGLKG